MLTINKWMLPTVEQRLEKLNRRAARMGVAPLTMTASNERMVDVSGIDSFERRFECKVDVEFAGAPITMPGGWILQGSIDFEDGHVIVNPRPGATVPTSYRNATPACDHCHTNRARASVVLFSNPEGRWIQVGRSCVADYFQTSPEQALRAAAFWSSAIGDLEGEYFSGGHDVTYVGLERLIAVGLRVVKLTGGFVSKSTQQRIAEEQDRHVDSTSGLVYSYLFGRSDDDSKLRAQVGEVEQADEERARQVIAWARDAYRHDDPSEYAHTIATLVEGEYVRERRMSMVLSIIGGYLRETERRAARDRLVNAHVGEVGKRQTFSAKFLGQNAFETDYGTMYIGRFATDAGMLVYKGGSPFWPDDTESGDECTFIGTIKKHDEYKGMRQTIVQRCILRSHVKAAVAA